MSICPISIAVCIPNSGRALCVYTPAVPTLATAYAFY
jgi:hypothetical protein